MKVEIARIKIFWVFLCVILTPSVSAQEKSITGKVTDTATNMALIGVSVKIEGTNFGTVTDNGGNFSLKVSPGKKLGFSFIGYLDQVVTVGQRSTMNISLQVEENVGDEVVVTGYGTVKKTDATGSLSVISSGEFNKGIIMSPQEMIVGNSAGVVITPGSGAPGSTSTILIRGGSSLNTSNDPLIIVDGVPIDNNNVSGGANFLAFVNPNDIETFTILKDGSSTAIYGSRGSNGVILINTKRSTVGSPFKITFNANTSIGNATDFVNVFTGDQMRQIASDHKDLYGSDSYKSFGTSSTDWQKEIFRPAVSQNLHLNLSGAYKSVPYRVSIGYTDQNGSLRSTEMKRYTGSVNLNPVLLNGNLRLNINAKGMNTDNNFGDAGALVSAINMDPTQAIYDNSTIGKAKSGGYFQFSTYGSNPGTPNPVEQLINADNRSNVLKGIANFQAEYKIPFIPDLKVNLNAATDYTESKGHNNRPITSPSTLTGAKWGQINTYKGMNNNNLFDFYLNYTRELQQIRSKIDVTGGYSWQQFKWQHSSMTTGYTDIDHPYQNPDNESFTTDNSLSSFFGRLNYTFLERYLFAVTVRNDASSRFANSSQGGLFPSLAFAWKIREESFLKEINVISDLKLRFGYGITSQRDISNYYPGGNALSATFGSADYASNIKWEQTSSSDLGIDFGFLKERITGTFDFYHRVTDNLLNAMTLSGTTTINNSLLTNVGSLENKGVEFNLNVIPVSTKDLSLILGFNISSNRNKITRLNLSGDSNYYIAYGDGTNSSQQVAKAGYPAFSYFMNKQVYNADGTPAEGQYLNSSDKYIYKNPAPDYLMGFSARFNYKKFDLFASARNSVGNYVYNQVAAGASYDQMYQNGYWRNLPTYLNDTKFVKRQVTSDYFVQNASFFKLDNISASYNFDDVYEHFKIRLSLTLQNLLTVTKYKGTDPEVIYTNINGVPVPGIDNNSYPRTRSLVLGVCITY